MQSASSGSTCPHPTSHVVPVLTRAATGSLSSFAPECECVGADAGESSATRRAQLCDQRMSGDHFFKAQALPHDLRALQSAVLWEWAITTGLPLQACAAQFGKRYRSFWPLIQLGDPLVREDRMFDIDEHSVMVRQLVSIPTSSHPYYCPPLAIACLFPGL